MAKTNNVISFTFARHLLPVLVIYLGMSIGPKLVNLRKSQDFVQKLIFVIGVNIICHQVCDKISEEKI